MAQSLKINTNSGDNIPDEKRGNSSLDAGKSQKASYIASEKGGAPRSNSYNKRAIGPERSLRFSKSKGR